MDKLIDDLLRRTAYWVAAVINEKELDPRLTEPVTGEAHLVVSIKRSRIGQQVTLDAANKIAAQVNGRMAQMPEHGIMQSVVATVGGACIRARVGVPPAGTRLAAGQALVILEWATFR